MCPCLYFTVSSVAKSVESVVCIFIIFRISISMTSTRFRPIIMSATHPMNLLFPHPSWEVEGQTAVFAKRKSWGCFLFWVSLWQFWSLPFLYQSHCLVDHCVTALSLTQRWASTCGPRTWIYVSGSGHCRWSWGSFNHQSVHLTETGSITQKLKYLKYYWKP